VLVVHPVVRGSRQGDPHAGDVGLGQPVLAVVDPDVPVDVEEAQGVAPGLRPQARQFPAEALRALQLRHALQLVPQRFYLRGPVQPHQPPQLGRDMLLEPLGTLDAQQGHEQEDQEGGTQAVEGRTDGAVDLPGCGQHAATEQDGQGHQHAGPRDPQAGLKQGPGVIQRPQARQDAVEAAVGGVPVQGGRTGFWKLRLRRGFGNAGGGWRRGFRGLWEQPGQGRLDRLRRRFPAHALE